MGDDGPSSDDIIKILITSDNHVGYNEKDEIRGNDSFRTFEEVLKIAADEKVRARSAGAPCPCTPSVRPSFPGRLRAPRRGYLSSRRGVLPKQEQLAHWCLNSATLARSPVQYVCRPHPRCCLRRWT